MKWIGMEFGHEQPREGVDGAIDVPEVQALFPLLPLCTVLATGQQKAFLHGIWHLSRHSIIHKSDEDRIFTIFEIIRALARQAPRLCLFVR